MLIRTDGAGFGIYFEKESRNAEGHAEALQEQQEKLELKVQAKMKKGKSAAQIAEELEEDISIIHPIYEKLKRQ